MRLLQRFYSGSEKRTTSKSAGDPVEAPRPAGTAEAAPRSACLYRLEVLIAVSHWEDRRTGVSPQRRSATSRRSSSSSSSRLARGFELRRRTRSRRRCRQRSAGASGPRSAACRCYPSTNDPILISSLIVHPSVLIWNCRFILSSALTGTIYRSQRAHFFGSQKIYQRSNLVFRPVSFTVLDFLVC